MNEKRRSSYPSRRPFLQTSTAAGAGLLLSDRIAPSLYAGGTDETLRVGLVGCAGRRRDAAVEALTADRNTRLVAPADAFCRLRGTIRDRPQEDRGGGPRDEVCLK